jgi:hypothetical protein
MDKIFYGMLIAWTIDLVGSLLLIRFSDRIQGYLKSKVRRFLGTSAILARTRSIRDTVERMDDRQQEDQEVA